MASVAASWDKPTLYLSQPSNSPHLDLPSRWTRLRMAVLCENEGQSQDWFGGGGHLGTLFWEDGHCFEEVKCLLVNIMCSQLHLLAFILLLVTECPLCVCSF